MADTHEFRIMLFGPRGVGKTSLLTAMYNEFNSLVRTTNGLQLLPDNTTMAKLENKLKQLQKPLKNSEELQISSEDGIMGTRGIESDYIFNLAKIGKKPFMTLRFIDFEGGYISEHADKEKINKITDLVNSSHVILIAVDTPAMVEPDKKGELGIYMKEVNNQEMVTNFLRNMIIRDDPKLLLICPLKCEKYLQDSKKKDDFINEKINKAYQDLIKSFKTLKNVCISVTPVQTVGNIVFSRMEPIYENDKVISHEFVYLKSAYTDKYAPVDCEQPLRYIFAFLLTLYLKKRSWAWLKNFFNSDKSIKEAIQTFAKDRKNSYPFEILQGHELLYHE